MADLDPTAALFEAHRARLRTLAHRILGSYGEADDAVQEAWLRLSRADPDSIGNLGGWLTTVTARVCLNLRRDGRTEPLLPDPVVTVAGPEEQAVLADSVGLALLVVLDRLTPAERVAFVLHDLFAVPFEEVAAVLGRSAAAARQLASRARRRVAGAPAPDADVARQREVVDAFFAAAREGDLDRLVAVLDPDVVLRADGGGAAAAVVRGARTVAARAAAFARPGAELTAATVNGRPGVLVTVAGQVVAVFAFTVRGGRVTAVDALSDPARLARLPVGRPAGTGVPGPPGVPAAGQV